MSVRMKPMCSLCTPCLPVLRKAVSFGQDRPAAASICAISARQAGCNSAPRGPRPAGAAPPFPPAATKKLGGGGGGRFWGHGGGAGRLHLGPAGAQPGGAGRLFHRVGNE